MKVFIYSNITKSSRGGGNQFLNALKKILIEKEIYAKNIFCSNIIIVNGHEKILSIFFLLIIKIFGKKIIIHRVDGPLSIVRGSRRQIFLDKSIYFFNQALIDQSIFQSKWSLNTYKNLNFKFKFPKVLYNFVDDAIFFKNKIDFFKDNKINLISFSWSTNHLKGFDIIYYLDKNLDFKKFNYYFIGNSPYKFKNIKMIDPINSYNLSQFLSKFDFYIHPSKAESCSNALIEALQCGLTPIVRNNSSNKELVFDQRFLFYNKRDILEKINFLTKNKEKLNYLYNNNLNKEIYLKYILGLKNNNDKINSNNAISILTNLLKCFVNYSLFKLYFSKN